MWRVIDINFSPAAVATGVTDEDLTRVVATVPFDHSDGSSTERRVQAASAARSALPESVAVDTAYVLSVEEASRADDATLRDAALPGGVWLLVALPDEGWPLRLPELLTALEVRGFRVALAAPERSRSVQLQVDRLRDAVGRGALVQLDAASVMGDHGKIVQQTTRTLLANGLAHLVGGGRLTEACATLAQGAGVEPETLAWMVQQGPTEVLAGGAVRPPRLGVPPPPVREPRESSPRPRGARPGFGSGPRPAGGRPGRPPRPGRPGGRPGSGR